MVGGLNDHAHSHSNIFILLQLPIGASFASDADKESFYPSSGFVPTADVAVKIAEIVLGAIYGEEEIKKERPFVVRQQGTYG